MRQALWAGGFPVPQPGGHKYRRGHAVVVSGDLSHTGAARLAARARCAPAPALSPLPARATRSPSMPRPTSPSWSAPVDGAEDLPALLADPRINAVVLGPGGGVGPPMRDMVLAALAGERAVVLDADALTSFAETPAALFAAIKAREPVADGPDAA